MKNNAATTYTWTFKAGKHANVRIYYIENPVCKKRDARHMTLIFL